MQEQPSTEPLLDRERPRARIEELLAGVPAGRGGLLVIEGEPGIGKTSLLADAARRGVALGMTVLRARAGELEQAYPYGVVRQLFEAPLSAAGGARREELLTGAAALARGVLDSSTQHGPETAMAVEHGLYWLSAGLAVRAPVLLLVDDAQWADEPSLRWLVYLSRRLAGLAVGVIVATRPAAAGVAALLGLLAADSSADRLVPAPLGADAVATLVRRTLGADAADGFCAACAELSGGNPLLLTELLRAAEVAGVPTDDAGTALLQGLASGSFGRAVLVRFGDLGPAAGSLAAAVAVLGREAELRHAAALAGMGVAAAAEVADRQAAVGLLDAGRPLRFAHPLVRTAVYTGLPAGRRAALHAGAARLLAAEGRPADEVATHLLHCERTGDGGVVTALRAAGRAAGRAGAPDAAAVFLRRALQEPPDPAGRVEVLHELGVAEGAAQDRSAVGHLLAALDGAAGPRSRAVITLDLARVALPGTEFHAVMGHIEQALADLDDGKDAELRRQLEAALLSGAFSLGTFGGTGPAVLHRAGGHEPAGETPGERLRLVWLAFDRFRRAEPVADVVRAAVRALGGGRLLAEETAASQSHTLVLNVLAACDEFDRAAEGFDGAVAQAREQGSAAAFGIASCFRSWVAHRRGRLREAEADSVDAVRVTAEGGLDLIHGYARAQLATVLVDRGDLPGAAAALADVPDDLAAQRHNDAHFLLHARGRLALATGNTAAAARDLLLCGERESASGYGNPAWIPWRSDAAAALSARGHVDRARCLAAEELALARRFGAPRALGLALLGAAVTERGDARIARLRDALAMLENSGARFDQARALVLLGGALRIARDRTAARVLLRDGLDLASRCGATGLADRARAELVADGARPRRDARRGPDALTAGELRVARMAADGLSNREIAQALFVTTKTVETHLGNTYAKLAVAGRAQLGASLAAGAPP